MRHILPLSVIVVSLMVSPGLAGDSDKYQQFYMSNVAVYDTVLNISKDNLNEEGGRYFPDSLIFDAEVIGHEPVKHIYPLDSYDLDRRAASELTPEYIGSALWGYSKDVQVVGDYAFCTFGAGLVILDISDPSEPVVISRLYTQSSPEGVTVYGDYAYLAAGWGAGAMIIVDISDVYNPVIVGRYGEDFAAWKIVLDTANTPMVASVCAGDQGVHFVDVSDPTNPLFLAHYNLMDTRDVLIVGDTAFVVDRGTHYFVILNVSDYSHFYGYSYIEVPGQPMSMQKKDDYIFVAVDDAIDAPPQIQVIDVSDIYNPVIVDTVIVDPLWARPWDAEIIGDTLFVPMGSWSYVHFYDISNPTDIIFIGLTSPSNTEAWNIDIVDSKMYVGCGYSAMRIFDISDLDSVYEVGGYSNEIGLSCLSGAVYNIKIADSLAYVLNCGALTPVEISDPANPGGFTCDEDTRGNRFDINGNTAYKVKGSSGTGGTLSIDISNPHNLIILSSLNPPEDCWDIKAEGDYGYIAADTAGLQVADIKDPTDMQVVGFYNEIYNDTNLAGCVAVRDNLAYVGDSWGIRAIDITDPTDPVKVGDYETQYERGVRRIILQDTLAFLAVANVWVPWLPKEPTMEIVNISDPANMTLVGSFLDSNVCGNSYDIALAGDYAFLANGGCIGYGLIVVDISDFSDMHMVGYYDTPADACIGIKVRDRYVYLTDYYGMLVLHVDYPSKCGDLTDNESIDLLDITYYISYLYMSGPPPAYIESADVNGDGSTNILDITYLIRYLYLNGPAPTCP